MSATRLEVIESMTKDGWCGCRSREGDQEWLVRSMRDLLEALRDLAGDDCEECGGADVECRFPAHEPRASRARALIRRIETGG